MKHSQAIIFINGDRGDLSYINKYLTKSTLLIGCDGGTNEMLKNNIYPNVIIGDFDSITTDSLNKTNASSITKIKYPVDKDVTDTELAIDYAVSKNIATIYVTCVLGTRIDHLLGNIFLLANPKFSDINIRFIEGGAEIYMIHDVASIRGHTGDIISFMPIHENVVVHQSSGIKYKLEKYTLSMNGNQGISNVMTGSVAKIDIASGTLLVIHQKYKSSS